MKIRAVGDRVVLAPLEENRETSAGILLPPDKYRTYAVGAVISANHPEMKPGTKVYYRRFDAQPVELKMDNGEYALVHIIRQASVVGIEA